MLQACSHLLLASSDVPRIAAFFSQAFGVTPQFANDMFADFVLSSRFRVAFFTPVGASADSFSTSADRGGCAVGVTVDDVDATYQVIEAMAHPGILLSGPPKDHSWGEKSFLLTDPDGNRWEIAQSPSDDGMLTDHSS